MNNLQVMRYAPMIQQEAPAVGPWCRYESANAEYGKLLEEKRALEVENAKMRSLLNQHVDAEDGDDGRGNYDLQTMATDAIRDFLGRQYPAVCIEV